MRSGLWCACVVASVCTASTHAAAKQVATFVASVPDVSIGVVEGDDAYVLAGLTNAIRLSDGRILVGSCAANEVRVYDAEGRYLRTIGRQGGGPGEFQVVRRVFPANGDSIGVADAAFPTTAHRVAIFAPDGSYARMIQLPPRVEVIGRFADGSFAGRLMGGFVDEPSVHRRLVTLYRLDAAGVPLDSVTGPWGLEMAEEQGRGPRSVRFARTASFAVLPDRLVSGPQDEAAFFEYRADLRTPRRVQTITRPEPMTNALRRQWDETRPVLIPRGGVIGSPGTSYASALPAYGWIVAGADGRVWVQDPYRPGVFALVWTAYRDGRAVARAELPPRFYPTQFGEAWVLGIAYDDLGVERVQVYDLTAGPLSGRRLTPQDAQPPDRPRCGAWLSR